MKNRNGTIKKCPICKKSIIGYPAISRKDNKTEICSNCGVIQALEQFEKYKKIVNYKLETMKEV